MNFKYFKGELTEKAIKAEYWKLAKANHPDLGGDESRMQAINNELDARLKSIDGKEQPLDPNAAKWMKSFVYKYNCAAELKLIQKIRQFQNLRLSGDNLEIVIDRMWIWVRGVSSNQEIRINDKTGIGFRQMSKVWYDGQASLSFYWHDFENDKFRRKSKYSARMYGVQTVDNKSQNQINY